MSKVGRVKHVFLGGNTPKGFFSYYHYVLNQKEAKRIFCIKGGPGVGKSTFMKKIASEMLNKGYGIEYMHCSSDPDSLDGVVISDIGIALLDGTAPHVVDPKNPGAVDEIINLGEYWSEEGFFEHRNEIIEINAQIGKLFSRAYKYLAAAKSIFDDIMVIHSEAMNRSGIELEKEKIIKKEFNDIPIANKTGNVRKLFGSAITPKGLQNYLDSVINNNNKVYIIKGAPGTGTEILLSDIVKESVARGFNVEAYYCPMDPETRIEHIVIPERSLAFTTSNKYHLATANTERIVDLNSYLTPSVLNKYCDDLTYDQQTFDYLLEKAIETIKKAKSQHDVLEKYYIPNMDFDEVQKCYDKIFERIVKYCDL